MKKILMVSVFGVVISMAPAWVSAAGTHIEHSHSKVGQVGDPANVSQTIEIIMDDNMRFTPSNLQVQVGETVKFSIKNEGQLPHELVIGSMEELQAHAVEMLATPEMEHEEPNMITVQPNGVGDLIWQFDELGQVDFACLIPGHTEAGMVGRVNVVSAQ